MDEGGGGEGQQLWTLYLHQAEKEPSPHAIRSFWLGRFLQTLPEAVLLRCREHNAGSCQNLQVTPKHVHTLPDLQMHTQLPPAWQWELEELGDSLAREKNTQFAAAAAATKNAAFTSKDAIFQLTGKSREPLWLHVQRADECLRSLGEQNSSSLSPAVHRLVVESIAVATDPTEPQETVLRPDGTLDWGNVETFLGTGIYSISFMPADHM